MSIIPDDTGTATALPRLLRLPEVLSLTGLSRSQLMRTISRGQFPRGVRISDGGRCTVWAEEEVAAWRAERLKVARVATHWADAEVRK